MNYNLKNQNSINWAKILLAAAIATGAQQYMTRPSTSQIGMQRLNEIDRQRVETVKRAIDKPIYEQVMPDGFTASLWWHYEGNPGTLKAADEIFTLLNGRFPRAGTPIYLVDMNGDKKVMGEEVDPKDKLTIEDVVKRVKYQD